MKWYILQIQKLMTNYNNHSNSLIGDLPERLPLYRGSGLDNKRNITPSTLLYYSRYDEDFCNTPLHLLYNSFLQSNTQHYLVTLSQVESLFTFGDILLFNFICCWSYSFGRIIQINSQMEVPHSFILKGNLDKYEDVSLVAL
jgi:hypothetical protein